MTHSTEPELGNSWIGKTCPYCQFPLKLADQVCACDGCGIHHHVECWEQNGGCTTFGCAGGRRRVAVAHPAPVDVRAPPSPEPPDVPDLTAELSGRDPRKARPNARRPLIIGVGAGLALAAVVAILVSIGFGLGRKQVALTPVSVTATVSTTPQATTALVTTTTLPTTTTTVNPTTTGTMTAVMESWGTIEGWTVVIDSVPDTKATSMSQAQAAASMVLAKGLDAGVLRSSEYPSLNSGYICVFSGRFATSAEAERHCVIVQSRGFADAYPRFVSTKMANVASSSTTVRSAAGTTTSTARLVSRTPSAGFTAALRQGGYQVTATDYGAQIVVPSGWTRGNTTRAGGTTIFRADGPDESYVKVETDSDWGGGWVNMEPSAKETMDALEAKYPDFRLLAFEGVSFYGGPALLTEFTYSDDEGDLIHKIDLFYQLRSDLPPGAILMCVRESSPSEYRAAVLGIANTLWLP